MIKEKLINYSCRTIRLRYDQLNRLKEARYAEGYDQASNSWQAQNNFKYRTRYKYDPNGNLLRLTRNGNLVYSQSMDSLNYYYFVGTNRLRGVMDNQITEPYENDINFMSTIDIYSYNERGDMIQDNMEKIYVDWLVNGKIKAVRRFATVADLPDLELKYD